MNERVPAQRDQEQCERREDESSGLHNGDVGRLPNETTLSGERKRVRWSAPLGCDGRRIREGDAPVPGGGCP